MPPLLQVDSQGISAFGETTAERLWRIQASTGVANEIQVWGADQSTTCRLTNVATPVVNADAVTKAYVDNVAANLRLKKPVRTLSSEAVTLSTLAAGSVMDGVTLVAGDRVLLVAQAEAVENGIWIIANSPTAPARPADYATAAAASGAYTFVDQGTVWKDRSFACITDHGSDVIDTDATEWVQFSSRSSALAGHGLVAGATNELDIDTAVVPQLSASNTFSGSTNTFTGTVSAPKVSNLTTASITANGDAVNLEFLNNRFNAFNYKAPVLVASTAAIENLATTLIAGYTLDDVTLAAGDRVLIKDQASVVENGIYVIAEGGAAPTRATDLPTAGSAYGAFVVVTAGTTFNDQAFVCTNNTSADSIVGTNAIAFSALVTQATGLAGLGLVENGRSLDVNTDNSTLEIASDQVRVKASGITNSHIATGTVANDRLVNSQVTLVTTAGEGLTSTNSGIVDLGGSVTLTVDHTYIPYLGQTNTYTAANTFNADVTVGVSNILTAPRVTGLTTALITTDSDAVNVQYLRETVTDNLQAKAPVRAASATAVTLAALMADSIVDGVTLAAADRVLLTAQASAIENGIYVIAAASSPARAADMDTDTIGVAGSTVVVTEGTVFAGRMFACTSPAASDTVGTHNLTFVVIGQSLAQLAGNALSANTGAMTLDVAVDNSTIEISSDALRLKDAGITNSKLLHDSVLVTTTTGSGLTQTMTDSASQPVLNGDLELGGSVALTVDHNYIPYLAQTNTFTQENTFSSRMRLTAGVAASTNGGTGGSPDGSLIVTGGAYVSGDLYCSSTLNFSDLRLKRNIADLGPTALDTICAIRGCSYEWNDHALNVNPGKPAVGVIAQELRGTAAEIAVFETETRPEGEGEDIALADPILAVDYNRLVPFLIESVKSLKRRCDDMDAEIQILKRARHV